MDALELVPLCKVTIPVSDVFTVENAPTGTLMVGELRDARFEGDRFKASQRGVACADWLNVTPSGTSIPDVRMTVETDDGAMVFIEYTGRMRMDTGVAFTAPTFRTGDERYGWLNDVQAVGKGFFDADAMLVTYPMLYEVR